MTDNAHRAHRRIYAITTAIVAFVMVFSIYKIYGPDFGHLGYPTYFRTELVIAKILGLAALLVPGVPARLKEWAYGGFAIVLVSAAVAHYETGDSALRSMEPLGFLIVLGLSNWSWHQLERIR